MQKTIYKPTQNTDIDTCSVHHKKVLNIKLYSRNIKLSMHCCSAFL